jgi:RNA polymerase sigma factor (sigma-70 family)
VARIALFLQAQKNDYQQLLWEDCQAAAGRHGMSLRAFSADHDPTRQAAQIREVLAEGKRSRPDVMLVSPVREADLPGLASEAGHRGVGWVLLNRWSKSLPELRARYPLLPIFSVTPDQYEIGHVQGRQFRSLLPKGGKVVYVRGRPGTSSAERRHEGVRRELAGSGIRLRAIDGDWSSEGGERAMAGWLDRKPPGRLARVVVGAQNDSMAAGARQALAAAAQELRRDVGAVHVTGCDGASSFGQRLVANGILTATVLVPPVAGRAVDEVVRMWAGGVAPPPEIVLDVLSYPELTRVTAEARPGGWLPGELVWDEAQLLVGLQAGDHLAQTVLFRRCREAVRRVLTRILHEPQDVADALQDTFIKVFRSACHVKDPKALRVWVLRVAESVGLDELRRRQRLRKRGMLDSDWLDLPAPGAPLEVRGALRDTYRVLSCLPDEERAVFCMRFIEGRELAKIAQASELSLATVKRRLGRAESRFMSLARRQPGLSEWVKASPARRVSR